MERSNSCRSVCIEVNCERPVGVSQVMEYRVSTPVLALILRNLLTLPGGSGFTGMRDRCTSFLALIRLLAEASRGEANTCLTLQSE